MTEEMSAFEMYHKVKNTNGKRKHNGKKKSVVNENSMLEDEYNLIKNVTQKSRNSSLISSSKKSKSRKNNIHKDQEMVKRKRTSKAQTDGVVINHRSGSSDTSDDSDSKKHSSGHNSGESTPPEHILDGDDVPLVEEVLGDMVGTDEVQNAISNGTGVTGENFLDTVMKMNKHNNINSGGDDESEISEFEQKVREKLGLELSPNKSSSSTKKKSNSKKRKIENGLGQVLVNEDTKVPSKKKAKLNHHNPDLGSIHEGKKCFEWMIQPVKFDKFFKDIWEKRPFHIKRENTQPQYYKHLFSTKAFDEILRSQHVLFTKNLDVTSYADGKRETHNPDGRAYAPVVWDFYNNGCSLRMLNPQTFDEQVWKLCATLQEFFGSFVGTNMYLTPPGTQGFAPHYDDVEVFILQLEGKKHWRVYEPRTAQETLPRYSSCNFSQDEIGKPIMDMILQPGDLLYMPRGTIHQGNCLEDTHSLHITVSCHQLNTYGDLLEKLLPMALKTAMEEDIEFRKGLPPDYLSNLGIAHSDQDTKPRRDFLTKVSSLMGKLVHYASVDGAVDQMGKQFMHNALPPYLLSKESARSVASGGEKWSSSKNRVVNRVELDPDTEIRLIRANCLRLVTDFNAEVDVVANDDKDTDSSEVPIRMYYCVENSREYQEVGPQFMDVDSDTAPAIEALIQKYPEYIKVEDLPMDELDGKMKVVQDLWERKLLLTKLPLEAHYDD